MVTTTIKEFPRQKISTAKKTTSWGKQNIDAAINIAMFDMSTGIRSSFHDKKICYDLMVGKLDQSDVQKITNPWNLEGTGIVKELQDYPIIKPKIDLLVGECAKRQFNWQVKVTNPDAVSEKEKYLKTEIVNRLLQLAQSAKTEADIKLGLQEIEFWSKFEYQDLRERSANLILSHLYDEQELEMKFLRGFEDLLIAGEELYCVDVINDEPVVRKVSPLNLYVLGMGDSPFIEDGSIIIEDSYVPPGDIVTEFYEELKSSEIDFLESRGKSYKTGETDNFVNINNEPTFPSGMFGEEGEPLLMPSDLAKRNFYEPFDSSGNVRKTRVVWESLRKVGILKYYDEDGDFQKDIVDENYTPNTDEGEDIEWIWITEWWEGTRVANSIYLKIQPRPIQFRRMGNVSYSSSGYTGIVYNADVMQSRSLVGILKPYQYLYDEFMYRIKRAFTKFKMPQIDVDFAYIPDGWEPEKWLYYAEEMGYRFKDSFKEGNKGQALGKMAGNFNQTDKIYNSDMGNYIQQHVLMLQHIDQQISLISGVSNQRQGQIENRETVGGIERSVLQSSHITEKYFKLHDKVKLRVLSALLETAKYAWRNKNEKSQYILDGTTPIIFDIDGRIFNESEYGIVVTDSTKDTELLNSIKQLSTQLVQRGDAGISQIIDIYMSHGIASMKKKIELAEERTRRSAEEQQMREQENAQQQLAMAQQQAQFENDIRTKELDLQRYKIDQDNLTKMKIALLQAETEDLLQQPEVEEGEDPQKYELEREKLKLQEKTNQEKINLDKQKLEETIRANKAKEVIARNKPKPTTSTKKSK